MVTPARETIMWKMTIQKGYHENTHQVSAYFDDGSGRLLNHICRGWFQVTDETEILRRQLNAVRLMKQVRGPDILVTVTLQGSRGYRPTNPITVDQFERELVELI